MNKFQKFLEISNLWMLAVGSPKNSPTQHKAAYPEIRKSN